MPTKRKPAKSTATANAATIRVGIGGWTYAPWRDIFYPAELAQRLELEYASRHVTAIEVNGTFYRAQTAATYAKWRSETPDGFVFSLKAPRYSTMRKELAQSGKAIDAFVNGGIAELGDRLGPINWQMPTTKAFDPADIGAFMDLLPRSLNGVPLRHVIEARHASFACDDYVDLARAHRIATVFTDSPDYPSFADVTSDFVYLRLRCAEAWIPTGYSAKALTAWAKRAQVFAEGGRPGDLPCVQKTATSTTPHDVFVYFINGAKERAPDAAMALLKRLRV